jgi:hypothetical protein
MILRIDGDARGLSHDPIVGKRLGPGCIDLKFWQVVGQGWGYRERTNENRNDFHDFPPGAGQRPAVRNALPSVGRNQGARVQLRQ